MNKVQASVFKIQKLCFIDRRTKSHLLSIEDAFTTLKAASECTLGTVLEAALIGYISSGKSREIMGTFLPLSVSFACTSPILQFYPWCLPSMIIEKLQSLEVTLICYLIPMNNYCVNHFLALLLYKILSQLLNDSPVGKSLFHLPEQDVKLRQHLGQCYQLVTQKVEQGSLRLHQQYHIGSLECRQLIFLCRILHLDYKVQ